MRKGPDFTGLGGYGPWPDNDPPSSLENPSPHYSDGYRNRMPGGAHYEGPTDIWIDRMVFPERVEADSDMQAASLEQKSRDFTISVGTRTGKNPGPIN